MNIKFLFSLLICACLSFVPFVVHAADPEVISDSPVEIVIIDDVRDNQVLLKSVSVSNEKITAEDATGFKAIMLSLIGDYETTVTDYTYQSGSSGYYSHSINVERDWSWIMSCCGFFLVVYCVLRTVGGLICK